MWLFITKKTMKTGSPSGQLNLSDIKKTFLLFVGMFTPIFLTALLQNMGRIQEIILGWLQGLGIPELLELMIVPAVISFFVVVKQFISDNR